MATHNLRLDTSKQLALPIGIDARVGEVGSCVIVAEITNNGEPMSLVGYTARFECCKPDKTVVRDAKCTIAGNKITYTLDKSATAVPGLVNVAYFALLKGSDVIETTANIAIRVMPSAESAGSGVSKDYLSEIDAMLEMLNAQKAAYDKAETTRAAAEAKRATDSAAATTAANTAAASANTAASASTTQTAACTAATNAALDVATTALSKRRADYSYANALIGSVQGAMAHVEDAWAADAVECRVEGKSAQVATVGKNLLRCIKTVPETRGGVSFTPLSDGGIKIVGTAADASAYINLDFDSSLASAVSAVPVGSVTASGTVAGVTFGQGSFSADGSFANVHAGNGTFAYQSSGAKMRTYLAVPPGGTVNVVVYPQIELGSTATPFEPYSGGKPSPSPDYPQEIDVMDGPVVVEACGKNLTGYPYTTFAAPGTKVVNGVTFEAMPDGTIVANGTATANADIELKWVGIQTRLYGLNAVVSGCPSGGAEDKYSIGIYAYRTGAFTNPVFNRDYGQGVVLTGMEYVRTYLRVVAGTTVSNLVFKPQIELGTAATPFEPYAATKQTITLPTDHNYLANLPDGTRDTLALRVDGVAVLVERVGKTKPTITGYVGTTSGLNYATTSPPDVAPIGKQISEKVYSDKYATRGSVSGNLMAYRTYNSVVVVDNRFTDIAETNRLLALEKPYFYSALAYPKTLYSADNGTTWSTTDPAAGMSAIPLHKGTNNVWCTDPLSPEVSLEYVQDTNQVIAELRAAVVASGATR